MINTLPIDVFKQTVSSLAGDACRGDVVLFKQNLYNSQRKLIGRRTVAGRIANESYGATTQNHTFTVSLIFRAGNLI